MEISTFGGDLGGAQAGIGLSVLFRARSLPLPPKTCAVLLPIAHSRIAQTDPYVAFRTRTGPVHRKMTINEWYALMGLRMGGSAEDRMKASFKLFDKNGDGELSRDELTEVISLVEFHKQYYEFLVAGRILNNGGKVRLRQQTDKTATEFVNKFFNDADTNNSNSIDIDEFVTALSKDSKALATLNLFAQGR